MTNPPNTECTYCGLSFAHEHVEGGTPKEFFMIQEPKITMKPSDKIRKLLSTPEEAYEYFGESGTKRFVHAQLMGILDDFEKRISKLEK